MEETVAGAVRRAARVLAEAGVDSPGPEARQLMAYALASGAVEAADDPLVPVGFSDTVLRGDEPVPDCFEGWLDRRARREPLQHVTGSAPFCGIDLAVGPGCFVPRPETELLVDWAVGRARALHARGGGTTLAASFHTGPVTVVDLFSGPGTVALGLAHLLSALDVPVRVTGVEIGAEPLAAARANLASLRRRGLLGDGAEVEFLQGDLSDPGTVAELGLTASADLVLANPPYVPESVAGEVAPEVLADPRSAVFAGDDGMALMAAVAGAVDLAAAPVAEFAVEHDDSTGPAVRRVLREVLGETLDGVRQHRDLAGRDRFVTGGVRRSPGHRPASRPGDYSDSTTEGRHRP